MPLVRIDLPAGKSAEYRRSVADVVYEALRATMQVPEGDRFQVIAEREPGDLLIDPGYLGIERGPNALIVQVTLSRGRSVEMKQAFYRAVADGLAARVGLRPEDVFLNLVEVGREDWSFGNGVAQYVETGEGAARTSAGAVWLSGGSPHEARSAIASRG